MGAKIRQLEACFRVIENLRLWTIGKKYRLWGHNCFQCNQVSRNRMWWRLRSHSITCRSIRASSKSKSKMRRKLRDNRLCKINQKNLPKLSKVDPHHDLLLEGLNQEDFVPRRRKNYPSSKRCSKSCSTTTTLAAPQASPWKTTMWKTTMRWEWSIKTCLTSLRATKLAHQSHHLVLRNTPSATIQIWLPGSLDLFCIPKSASIRQFTIRLPKIKAQALQIWTRWACSSQTLM